MVAKTGQMILQKTVNNECKVWKALPGKEQMDLNDTF